jgi:hypothetical protein
MTDPVVTLEPAELTVEPGAQVRAELTVRNPGSVVEEYRLEVLGELPGQGPPEWAQLYPAELKVYPKETGTATVVFAPPKTSAAAVAASGRFPFGVRAVSTLAGDRSAVAEGDLEVGRVFGLQATITPMTSSGRWRGYHLIGYTNWGNAPVHLRLRASDPDQKLGFLLQPSELDVPLGASAQARLKVRTRKPYLRGSQTRLPFEVVAEPEGVERQQPPAHPMISDPNRPVVSGALQQKPILSRMTVTIATLVAVALVGAIILALKQPKPKQTFESAGPPDPPVSVTAKAVPNGKIQVNWQGAREVESYKLLTRLGTAVVATTTVDGQQTQFVTVPLAPSTVYCFTLESVRGATHSADSAPAACAATVAAPPSSTAPSSGSSGSGSGGASGSPGSSGSSGGGSSAASSSGAPSSGSSSGSGASSSPGQSSSSGTPLAVQPGDWIVVFGIYRTSQRAADAAAGLSSSFAAQTLHSTDYPNWVWKNAKIVNPFWAVYVDTKTLDATNSLLLQCRQRGFACTATQPAG